MFNLLFILFEKYDLHYDRYRGVLSCYKPIKMKDFLTIKRLIRKYNLNINEIRVIERTWRW